MTRNTAAVWQWSAVYLHGAGSLSKQPKRISNDCNKSSPWIFSGCAFCVKVPTCTSTSIYLALKELRAVFSRNQMQSVAFGAVEVAVVGCEAGLPNLDLYFVARYIASGYAKLPVVLQV
jgi:hypothetical protein